MGVAQGNVDPKTGLPKITTDSGWVRTPQSFPVRLILDEGRPKGVRQLAEATQFGPFIRHFATLYDYQPERGDAVMATGPLYHGGSMIMCTVVALNCGVTTVLIPRWNSEECLRLIERHRISQAFFVPTMFHRLLALPEATRRRYDLRSLRLILHGRRVCDAKRPRCWECSVFAVCPSRTAK